ncbi:hypothetical protein ACFL0M_03530 [Thermodesulfobacteriota bacterium]
MTSQRHGGDIICFRRKTVAFIEALEQDLKVPVVSVTQAGIWAVLSQTGVGEAKPGFGQLLRTLKKPGKKILLFPY